MSRERPDSVTEMAHDYVRQEERSFRNRRVGLLYSAANTLGLGIVIAAQENTYVSAYIELMKDILSKVGPDYTKEQIVSLLKIGIPFSALQTGINAFRTYRQARIVTSVQNRYAKLEKQQS